MREEGRKSTRQASRSQVGSKTRAGEGESENPVFSLIGAALPCTLLSSSRVRLSLQVTSKDFKAFSLSILILAGGKVSSERRFSHDSMVRQKLSTHTCCRTAAGGSRDNTHPATGHRPVTSAVLCGKPPHLCARALPPRTPGSAPAGAKKIPVKTSCLHARFQPVHKHVRHGRLGHKDRFA